VANRPAEDGTVAVESLTGGNRLGPGPAPGTAVTVVAYNNGVDDRPVTCAAVVRIADTYPAFDCPGFSQGTSGGPWLAPTPRSALLVVQAIIGGPNHGGCDAATSYSSVFGTPIFELLSRASTGGPPDELPEPRGDGC
jgi:hypothetical protein